jgi:hypothetical protein
LHRTNPHKIQTTIGPHHRTQSSIDSTQSRQSNSHSVQNNAKDDPAVTVANDNIANWTTRTRVQQKEIDREEADTNRQQQVSKPIAKKKAREETETESASLKDPDREQRKGNVHPLYSIV